MNDTSRLASARTRIEHLETKLQKEQALRYTAENNERCLRELAEQIREVFWMTNPLGDTLVYISPAYERIWGQTCRSLYEDPGRRLAWVHDDDREAVLIAFKRDAINGDYDQTFRILRPDGEMRWIRDRAFPVTDDDGEVYRLAGFALDITDTVEANDDIAKLHTKIDRRERLSVFAALGTGLAHDLSQPLTAARNFLAQVRMRLDPARNRELAALEQADCQIERAVSVIRHLRDFAREGKPTRERMPLNTVIEGVHQIMDPALREHDIRYTGPSAEQLEGIEIPLDRVFAQQILRSLIANAIDSPTREEQAAREIQVRVSENDEYVDIEVADSGEGIPEGVEPFKPFVTSKDDGLGLGLAMSRTLARSHGGDLFLASRGHGDPNTDSHDSLTRFVLRLPRT